MPVILGDHTTLTSTRGRWGTSLTAKSGLVNGNWEVGRKTATQSMVNLVLLCTEMHNYNIFSNRGIFPIVLNHVDDCPIFVICWPMNLEYREVSPSLGSLAFYQLQRFCLFLNQEHTQLITLHSLLFPKHTAFLHFLVPLCTLAPSPWVAPLFLSM